VSTAVKKSVANQEEFPIPAKPRISSGRFVMGCLGVTLLLLVAAAVIPWIVSSRQGAARLNAAVNRGKSRGEPLASFELNDFYVAAPGRPDMTKELIEALIICETASKSPVAASLPVVGQGGEPPPLGQKWREQVEAEKFLAQSQKAIETFHEFARRNATARFPVDFTPGVGTLLPNTQRVRGGSRILSLQFHVHCHKGEFSQAVDCIVSQLALAGALEQEPTLVSQLVRIAISGVGISEAQQLVRETNVPDVDLKRLQAQLRKIDALAGLKKALAGERTMCYTACLDPKQLAELNGPSSGLSRQVMERQPQRIFDAAKMLEINLQIAEGADESLFKAREEAQAADDEMRTIAGSLTGKLYYMYTLMLTPAYSNGIDAFAKLAAARDSADAAIAAELYRRKTGKWPAKLEELVPEYLPAVPTDPFTNLPLVLKAGGTSCKVYSVGRDGVDHGGNLQTDLQPGTDLGFEMPAASEKNP